MRAEAVRTLFDYSYWANHRLLEVALGLSPQQVVAPAPVPHGSLLGTLVHIFAAEQVWRARCQEGVSPAALATVEAYPTLEALTRAWEAEEQAMRSYLATLTDQDMERVVTYRRPDGRVYSHPLWQALVHVVNHGTQHRGEAALLLTGYGRSPGDIDFIVYLRGR
jgi:uncharacterized damage-inducible protein DinB